MPCSKREKSKMSFSTASKCSPLLHNTATCSRCSSLSGVRFSSWETPSTPLSGVRNS
ncbi:Uncharacterised protein [Vibrio cholerae]|nr:Uncharacterised protein [Vibrio cholerae]CSI39374.1 Uncharacterised protein [Vibrio cholerae]